MGGQTGTSGDPPDPRDENHNLAKVRVAGSNPVFRSILAGQTQFFDPESG